MPCTRWCCSGGSSRGGLARGTVPQQATIQMEVWPESTSISWIMNFVVPAYCCMLSEEQVWSPFAAADFSLCWLSFKTGKSPVGCQCC